MDVQLTMSVQNACHLLAYLATTDDAMPELTRDAVREVRIELIQSIARTMAETKEETR